MKKRKKIRKKRSKFNQSKQVKDKDDNKSSFELMLLREVFDEGMNALGHPVGSTKREKNYLNYKLRNSTELLGYQVPSPSPPGLPQ